MQWRIQTRKGGGLKYTPFIFNLELSSMAGEKIKGGSGGAPMEFPGAGGLEPPSPPAGSARASSHGRSPLPPLVPRLDVHLPHAFLRTTPHSCT